MNRPSLPPAVRLITVDAAHEGQRIDNFLMTTLKGVPRSHVYQVLRTGQVRVNKGRVRQTYRLQIGDQVRVPPVTHGERPQGPVMVSEGMRERLEDAILYEDKGLIVLNKPATLAVHGGSGLSFGVIEALRALRPTAPFLELVHRLDRDTSGCLMVAKRRSTLRAVHALLRAERGVDKRYLALLAGRWAGNERAVDLPLAKNQLSSGERMVRVEDDGKAAVSLFRPIERFATATLMEIRPLTGRTHQIRVHGAATGHPVAGDDKYGDEAFNRAMKNQGLKRMFLHAHRLEFILPEAEHPLVVEAPLEASLEALLVRLRAGVRP